jgi:hypothetical protein
MSLNKELVEKFQALCFEHFLEEVSKLDAEDQLIELAELVRATSSKEETNQNDQTS